MIASAPCRPSSRLPWLALRRSPSPGLFPFVAGARASSAGGVFSCKETVASIPASTFIAGDERSTGIAAPTSRVSHFFVFLLPLQLRHLLLLFCFYYYYYYHFHYLLPLLQLLLRFQLLSSSSSHYYCYCCYYYYYCCCFYH